MDKLRKKYKNESPNGIHPNVDGIISKSTKITDVIQEYKPQKMCIKETMLNNKISNEVLNLGEYDILRKDTVENHGGGAIILMHKNLKVNKHK